MSDTLWEEWQLDSEFLEGITAWAEKNPKTSLHKLMEKICNAVDPLKEFFELVPDGPIPFRGIVKALAHLVQLGKAVASAKQDVREFALQVIHLVEKIQTAFADGQRRRIKRSFTRTTWKNLEEIRDIIEQICKWAFQFLSKGTTLENLNINNQINDFKERIRRAQNEFIQLESINHSRGIDMLLDYLGMVSRDQRRILDKLRRFKGELKSQLDNITLQLDKLNKKLSDADAKTEAEALERRKAEEAEQRRKEIQKMLDPYVVADPSHGAQDKQSCAEGTRVEDLRGIDRWVKDLSPGSQNFLWLSGDPGCGKSAVTASLAESARKEDILWGEFFINRNNPSTTDPIAYFPTIASQLIARSSKSRLKILDRLSTSNTPRNTSPENAATYFVDALCAASELDPKNPVVIVIDGLDETDRRQLEKFATIFAQLFNDERLTMCPNVKIFIASRTEDVIRNPFAHSIRDDKHVKSVYLDTKDSRHDVKEYMLKSLHQTWKKHNLPWNKWPPQEKLVQLTENAAGLFIWAVTVLRYIEQRLEEDGEEGLSSLFDDFHLNEPKGIDALYSFIVLERYKTQIARDGGDIWALQTFRRLVGAIVVLCEPLSLDNLSKILHLRQTPDSEPVDVIYFVRRLRTVLVSGTDAIHGQTIPRLHKSFFEYLTGGTVDERFKVDTRTSHRELGICCLRQLSLAPFATASHKMPTVFRYATRFWSQHLSPPEARLSGIMIMDKDNPLKLPFDVTAKLEQLSRRKPSFPPIGLNVSNSSVVVSVLGQKRSWDIGSGLIQNGITFREVRKVVIPKVTSSDPLQGKSLKPTMTGPLPSHNEYICWAQPSIGEKNRFGVWNVKTGRLTTLEYLNRGREWTSSFGTAFENGHFAEARDGTIRIWEVQSTTKATTIKSTKFYEDTGNWEARVSCLALSAMASTLAVGCDDGSIHFWDIRGNAMQYIPSTLPEPRPDVEQRMPVITLAFSSSGDTALSLSENEVDVLIWAFRKDIGYVASVIHTGLEPNSKAALHSISFLHNIKTVVSGHGDGTIRFWDVKSSEPIGKPMTASKKNIISFLQYSNDGDCVISGTDIGQIDVWDVETRQRIYSYLTERPTTLSACIFAHQNSIHRLCIGGPSDLTMLEIRGGHKDLKELGAPFFALSVDGSKVAIISSDIIHLRDAATGDLIAESSVVNQPSGIIPAFYPRARHAAIFFNSDGCLLTKSNGNLLLWEHSGKRLACVSPLPPSIQTTPPLLFNCDDYYIDQASSFHDAMWIPSKIEGSGLWAVISDDKLIRSKSEKVVVTQLRDL